LSRSYGLEVLTATGRGTTAPTADRNIGGNAEARPHPIGDVIDGDVLGLLMQFFVDQHCEAVDFKYVVGFFRFIQNHGEGCARSPAGLQENPNRGNLLFLEVILENNFRFFRHVNH